MATSRGTAAVHTVPGTLAFTGLVTTQNRMVGASVQDEFAVAELRDGNNNVIGAFASGRVRRATFDIVPYDSNGVLATAKSNVKLPDPLAVVTIAGFGVDELDGTWNYVGGGSIALSTDGYIRVTLPCAQYDTGNGTPAALAAVT